MSDSLARHRRLSPLVRGSIGLHAGALGAALIPGAWPWSLAAIAANHALLTATGLWPRSTWLGANVLRLPITPGAAPIAITIDDGPDPAITPQVLDQLDAGGAKATFFCIGERAARHPQLAREIVRRGHAIENHSQRHRHHFSLLGPRGLEREIGAAQQSIANAVGRAPLFFRAPAGLRNPFLDPVLQQLGLRLVSWTRRGFDTRTSDPQQVLDRLTRRLAAGDILLVHDSHCAKASDGQPVVLQVLPKLLEAITAAGLRTELLEHALASPIDNPQPIHPHRPHPAA
ncbi:MAG: polysaccharide deacetylase family protein [Burkholderiales bacterium]